MADRPRPLDHRSHRLVVKGAVERPLELTAAELDAGHELVATLDCTGGFYSTQRWRGGPPGPPPRARRTARPPRAGRIAHRVPLELRPGRRPPLLLATHVGGEPLSHDQGAPVRLVAPGRRGFQWVKWVSEVEVHEHPDDLAPAATVWSSFTAAGRGA